MPVAPHPLDTAQTLIDLMTAADVPDDYKCEGPGPCPFGARWEVEVEQISDVYGEASSIMRPLCHTHYAQTVEVLPLYGITYSVRRVG